MFANLSPSRITFHPILFSGGQPAKGISGIMGKALAYPFLQACADQKAVPATLKHWGNTPEESLFPSAEHSNFPKQPRERVEVQPIDQRCRQTCRKSISVSVYDNLL